MISFQSIEISFVLIRSSILVLEKVRSMMIYKYEEENFLSASKCHDVQLTYFYDARETLVERCIADYPHTLKVNRFDIFFSKYLDVELESFFLNMICSLVRF